MRPTKGVPYEVPDITTSREEAVQILANCFDEMTLCVTPQQRARILQILRDRESYERVTKFFEMEGER